MADRRDFYEVLGVARTASQDEIQRAYRTLARQYHPDVNKDPGAEQQFQEIAEAYDVLSDPDTRRRYDAFGHDFRQVPEGVDAETWARARAGAGAGARSGPRGGAWRGPAGAPDQDVWFGTGGFGDASGFGDVDIESLFGDMFGGGGRRRGARRGWGSVAGADQEAEIELSVEDAYHGGRRTITMSGPDGPRTIEVDIPPGVVDGDRIRLAGQGGRGSGGATSGDLYLIVRLTPDRRFRVEGRDIHVDLRLAPWEAALGATVAVETPDGEAKVTVPAGTSSGRRLRLRGRGMPNRRGAPGDLYAEAKILVPKKPTDQQRRLWDELAALSHFDPRQRS